MVFALSLFMGTMANALPSIPSELWVEGDPTLQFPEEGKPLVLSPLADEPHERSREVFLWPLLTPVPISSPYGLRWGKLHAGIDIAATHGSPIRATRSGVVILATNWGGYGKVVALQHGDTFSLYGHLSRIAVSLRERVKQGQKIGEAGNTGHSLGTHLHFELRDAAGRPQNPLKFSYER